MAIWSKKLTHLYLIRHGISVSNEAELVTGDKADALSERGFLETSKLSGVINPNDFDACYTSDWQRAFQTAQLLSPVANWKIEPNIGETNGGLVANQKFSEFRSKYPLFYENYRNNYPGGESHYNLQKRVLTWFKSVCSKDHKILVVTHSGPINIMLQHAAGLGMDVFPSFNLKHLSLSCISSKDGNLSIAFFDQQIQEHFLG